MIRYKIDVISALREKGINVTVAKQTGFFTQPIMRKFANDEAVSFKMLDRLCYLLDLEPEDIIEFVPDEEERERLMKIKDSVHIKMRETDSKWHK